MSIRYETDDPMHQVNGEDRRATALDPEVVERAQPPAQGPSRASGRRSSRDMLRRSSQAPTDPLLAGPTQPYQAARGKRRPRRTGEIDRSPTQTFGVPEPLPPSPAGRESGGWFRPALRTESIPDLSAMTGGSAETSMRNLEDSVMAVLPEPSERVQAPARRRRPILDLHARPWLFPTLLAATCLAVGMVLGALLFGSRGGAEQSDKGQVIIRCSDPPTNAPSR